MKTSEFIYHWRPAEGKKLPILLSIPHCGSFLPEWLSSRLCEPYASVSMDTDWFVDQLYEFAPELGISCLSSHFSRYVIDLNRSPDSGLLYDDGRMETGLVPTRSFVGERLYQKGQEPGSEEISERLSMFYEPYHDRIRQELQAIRDEFGVALLWEAHSIRRVVPSIQKDPFPDLILGDQDGRTAGASLISAAKSVLSSQSRYQFSHNHPFKGGYITRLFGQPETGIHALQLEMTQHLYMDEEARRFEPAKASPVQAILKETLLAVGAALRTMT